ncbi:MAG: hypothetical protein Q8K78_04750, partial [Planctomycetaceae bacterium]|nr:hypothetical protein [Planctomycetaceae bacterium]
MSASPSSTSPDSTSRRRSPVNNSPPWGSLTIIAAMILGGLALETDDHRHVHLRGWPAVVLPEICWSQ